MRLILLLLLTIPLHAAQADADAAKAKPVEKPAEKKGLEIPAKALKKLAGKSSYKDGVLTVAYDWSNAKQLGDWDLGDVKPTSEKGALRIGAADSIESKVKFVGTAKITGSIGMENFAGKHISAPNYLYIEGTSYNAWIAVLHDGNTKMAEGKFNKDYTQTGDRNGFLAFEWAFVPGKTTFKFGVVSAGKECSKKFDGAFTLNGGDGGNGFKSIVLSGTPDEAWAKTFFELADAPAAVEAPKPAAK